MSSNLNIAGSRNNHFCRFTFLLSRGMLCRREINFTPIIDQVVRAQLSNRLVADVNIMSRHAV